jgi:hypothetical protein
MRLGCAGCLSALIGLAVTALILGATIGVGARMLGQPATSAIVMTAVDGSRAQQKLFDLTRRRRATAETIIITEPEVNALLTRHLVEARGVQLQGSSARLLGGDRLEVTAYRPLGRILEEMSLAAIASVLPASWRERPIWFRVGAHVRVDERPPRHLLLDVDALAIGRQRVPALALRLLLDPGGVGLLRWSLPSHIESVTIEPGRAVIRTAADPRHASSAPAPART